jgi:RNA polymerase sigma factor (sigma-70 family)
MVHTPDDSALMLRYKDGDVAAFDILYRRHKDAIYRYLLRLCGHRDIAEDIFQEVWGKIVNARKSYRPTAKFTTFLYRVAHNCFIDHVRRNKRHSNNTTLEPEFHSDPGETLESSTERSLARERLLRALAPARRWNHQRSEASLANACCGHLKSFPTSSAMPFFFTRKADSVSTRLPSQRAATGRPQKAGCATPSTNCARQSTSRRRNHDH